MNRETINEKLRRLLDPVFLMALVLLLLNDNVWKQAFHNGLTGKLSDFAGLYAFAWVAACLLPHARKQVICLFALAFTFWKSPFSAPLLDAWNLFQLLPLHRVVDMGDCVALVMLPIASWRFARLRMQFWQMSMPRAAKWTVLAVSLIAFVSTSRLDRFKFDKVYNFSWSPQQMVDRLNALNKAKKLHNLPLSLHHERANEFRDEEDIRIYLHHNKEITTKYDTIYGTIDDSVFVDELQPYQVPLVDSMYVNPDGFFEWHFQASIAGLPDSLLTCPQLPAIMKLNPVSEGSRLSLITVTVGNCREMLDHRGDRSEIEVLQDAFEKSIVAPLRETEIHGNGKPK